MKKMQAESIMQGMRAEGMDSDLLVSLMSERQVYVHFQAPTSASGK
jgi:hypothetical protein